MNNLFHTGLTLSSSGFKTLQRTMIGTGTDGIVGVLSLVSEPLNEKSALLNWYFVRLASSTAHDDAVCVQLGSNSTHCACTSRTDASSASAVEASSGPGARIAG